MLSSRVVKKSVTTSSFLTETQNGNIALKGLSFSVVASILWVQTKAPKSRSSVWILDIFSLIEEIIMCALIDLIIDSSRPSIVLSSSDSDIQMHLKASQVMKLYSKCLILFYFGNADGFAHRLQKELQAYEKLVNFKVILLLNETKSTTQ